MALDLSKKPIPEITTLVDLVYLSFGVILLLNPNGVLRLISFVFFIGFTLLDSTALFLVLLRFKYQSKKYLSSIATISTWRLFFSLAVYLFSGYILFQITTPVLGVIYLILSLANTSVLLYHKFKGRQYS